MFQDVYKRQALAPLNPTFVIEGPDGTRTQNMEEMYAGFGRSAIDPYKEMVTQIRIPCPAEHEAASFVRLELRKSLSLPMLNTAAMARVEDGVVKMVRITTGPVGVGPKRAKAAEEWLTGKEWTPENLRQAAKLVMEDANPRSNPLRGSKEYREDTLPVIVRRALEDSILSTAWLFGVFIGISSSFFTNKSRSSVYMMASTEVPNKMCIRDSSSTFGQFDISFHSVILDLV